MFHKLNNEEDLQKRNTAFFNSEFNIVGIQYKTILGIFKNGQKY